MRRSFAGADAELAGEHRSTVIAVTLRPGRPFVLGCLLFVCAAGCGCSDDTLSASVAATDATVPVTVQAGDFSPAGSTSDTVASPADTASTTTSSSTTTSTSTTTTSTSTTTTSTTVPAPGAVGSIDLSAPVQTIGASVGGRPIVAERFGEIGGRRVLVIGVIHGNEDAGVAVIDALRTRAADGLLPTGVELWLVESMNPDGQAAQIRQNANAVDLNRNFPHNWGTIGVPGDSQYAGPAAASEPETQTMVEFISALRPELAIWYHQDANLVIPGTGRDGAIRARYAELTALPLADCCAGGGIYTGIAATWARNNAVAPDGVAFIVELPGGDLAPVQVDQHAGAVLTVAGEL